MHNINNFIFQEGMLNKLQEHIEKEERNWRSQLELKENEIEQLKEKQINQVLYLCNY